MKNENSKKSAFPVVESYSDDSPSLISCTSCGLTKREYFAAKAMQGLCVNNSGDRYKTEDILAKNAVEIADELLKQLEK